MAMLFVFGKLGLSLASVVLNVGILVVVVESEVDVITVVLVLAGVVDAMTVVGCDHAADERRRR